jgi:hypothetical protein
VCGWKRTACWPTRVQHPFVVIHTWVPSTSRLFDCNARCAGVAKGQTVWQTAATAGCDGDLQCLTFTSLSQPQWKGGLAEHPTSPSRRRVLGPVCSVSRFSISDVFARPLGVLSSGRRYKPLHTTHARTHKEGHRGEPRRRHLNNQHACQRMCTQEASAWCRGVGWNGGSG